MSYILQLNNVSKTFESGPFWNRNKNNAVKNISLILGEKESQFLGIVGESGSGKSTLALLILGFLSPTKGEVKLNDDNIQKLNRSQKREFLRIIQPVYQDPFASFNPFYRINRVLEYPLIKYKLASTKSKIYDEIKNIS